MRTGKELRTIALRPLIFLFILFLTIPAILADQPGQTPATGFVNDYADILTPLDEQELTTILAPLYDRGLAQVAIITIDTLEGQDSFSYARALAEGVVGDDEKNNGLLLLIAVEERDYRFVTGRGLEATLPDALLSRIAQEKLIPAFIAGEYATGLIDTSTVISDALAPNAVSSTPPEPPLKRKILIFILSNPLLVLTLIALIILLISKRHGRDGNDLLHAAILGSMLGRGRGGFGGGGFGGFGGGSFGGGGAGGRW